MFPTNYEFSRIYEKMFIHYRTKGFILKKVDRGEADQLLTVYTKDFGKLEILAKAVRKISSKLKSGAQIFYLSEIEFIQGKGYKTLTDASLIEGFENLRNDLKSLKIAYQISEIFDDLVKGQERDDSLWNLLNETFNKLDTKYKMPDTPKQSLRDATGQAIYKIYYYFVWNLFSILGYEPDLYHCAVCQKGITPENLFFSRKEGGIICNLCKKSVKSIKSPTKTEMAGQDKKIKPEIIKILRILLKRDWPLLFRLKIENSNLKSLNTITSEFYSYIRPE